MAASKYPMVAKLGDKEFTFRFMEPEDREALIAFTRTFTESDLWFVRRDVTNEATFDEWFEDIEHDRARTLLVFDPEGTVVAYGSIYYNQLFWSRHLAEMRVMVGQIVRGRGMGQKIARELTLLAKDMGFDKVIVYIAANDKAAQRMVDYLDFKAEAILPEWIKGRDDRTHDLLIMSTDLSDLRS